MKAIAKINLKIGKLNLPIELFKATDDTTSVRASEVTKVNGKIYKVNRKPYVILEDGTEKDIDKTQILKSYEKDNGEIALFTKDEQSQLLKRGSSREWDGLSVVDKSRFDELSFQKQYIAFIEIDKKKQLLNQQNLKYFAMLKEGLQDKAIITQALFKNCEYPIVITNYGSKLLVRFLHYKNEIRDIQTEQLPKLSEQELTQAKTFMQQHYSEDFNVNNFENKTEEQVMKLINSKGMDVETPEIIQQLTEQENPFV